MSSTYTTNTGIQKPANGEQDGTWGDVINANMDIIDRLSGGVGSITLSASTYTLTVANGTVSPGHYSVLSFVGAPAAAVTVTVSPNTAQRVFLVRNTCGKNVTLTQGSGATVVVATGTSQVVYCDGAGATASVVSLSATFAITAGSINGTPVGATTPSTGAFTTLSSSAATITGGSINGTTVGATTPSTGTFTTLSSSAAAITGGSINGTPVGATTPSTGAFTTLSSSAATITGGSINGTTVGATTPSSGAFTTLTVDTNVLVVDATNNYVGVNTATPAAGLHVKDALDAVGAVPSVRVESTGSGTGLSPVLDLYRNSASPTVGDNLAAIMFKGNNNAAAITSYGMIYGFITAPTTGLEYGGLGFQVMRAGTLRDAAILTDGGDLLVSKALASFSTPGVEALSSGRVNCIVDGSLPLAVNRLTNDGVLVQFHQDGTLEGSISVSGTTVSFNGGHLSRWAQLPGNAHPELLKGTVLSNLDDMSHWEGEDNEQLNRVKVSDVAADRNVAGVFVAWENDTDLRVAMTGDMVIRIAPNTVVSRGDLLVSDGSGCAMPQGDDLVRSSTVAKVTSTHVSLTYPDGSYCVPCVLMAC